MSWRSASGSMFSVVWQFVKSGTSVALPADQKFTLLKMLLCDALACLVSKQSYTLSDKILLRQSFLKGILQTLSFILLNIAT